MTNIYKLALYSLAVAFIAGGADAAPSVRSFTAAPSSYRATTPGAASASGGAMTAARAGSVRASSPKSTTLGRAAATPATARLSFGGYVNSVAAANGGSSAKKINPAKPSADPGELEELGNGVSALEDIVAALQDDVADIKSGISDKADKASGATNGHLAGLDSGGNLTDSGIASDDVLTINDVGTGVGNVVAVGTNGKIDTALIDTTGLQGSQGADGKSAYEVAVEGGFLGNRDEWLASLQGAVGPQGPEGPQGATGPAGTDGTVLPDAPGDNYALLRSNDGTPFWVEIATEYSAN
ncbi:MAG: hypothetical protein LBO08_00660 [Rickettsiales bacterium]|jgi:hypothetical protein|nr:hypothetical protein [Rickettsiales bacterium]